MINFNDITLKVARQTLLVDANLLVGKSDKVVIRGSSGCGKSSLLKSAVGALQATEGSVHVDGLELSASTVAEIRSRIAFIGQEPVLGTENVRDALLLPFRFKAHQGNTPDNDRVTRLLDQLYLSDDILEKPCKRISGGEKQRIVIARALLLNKSIFLADEVTSALDPESKSAVMGALFRTGVTLLSVSHDPDWIKSCDRTITIEGAQLIESVADQHIGNRQSKIGNGDLGGAP